MLKAILVPRTGQPISEETPIGVLIVSKDSRVKEFQGLTDLQADEWSHHDLHIIETNSEAGENMAIILMTTHEDVVETFELDTSFSIDTQSLIQSTELKGLDLSLESVSLQDKVYKFGVEE